ncbi:histidine kinase [Micromonospora musae]|uniref:sensor histidine kinase n=1 Tax=Micromonospora musae TaxID=1894970 RepID=UPI00343535BB
MSRQKRDRFRGIAAYVHASHAALALASFAAPVVALALEASVVPGLAFLVALFAGIVAAGGALAVAVDFAPWHRLTRPFAPPRRRALLSVAVVVAALVVILLLPSSGGAVGVAVIPLAWALRAVADGSFWSGIARMFAAALGCGLVTALTSAWSGEVWDSLGLAVAVLLAFGLLGQDSIYILAIELDDLRALEADRAVATERKRLAGDLHDIQGQHLGLITVEAELVTKLIATGDTAGAAAHARRLQAIAGDALDELHRVVHDTRAVTLDQELTNAARVLEAAGIAVARSVDRIDFLSETADRLFGLTVREAITNILKHSRTRDCTIQVRCEARAGNDGIVLTVTDSGPAATHAVRTRGTGLIMLRERYLDAGGECTFVSGPGAELTAWVPMTGGGSR